MPMYIRLSVVEQLHIDKYAALMRCIQQYLPNYALLYPEMQVFAHTKLVIKSILLMPYWEIFCIAFYNTMHLLTFLSDLFKCLMLCTNLHFSLII